MEEMNICETKPIDREKVLIEIYKTAFPLVAKYIRRMGGSLEEAKDVFQDAMVVYYEKNPDVLMSVERSHQAYILGIAQNLWFRKFNNKKRHVPLKESMNFLNQENGEGFISGKEHSLIQYLEKAGKKCMDLLHAFYYEKKKLDSIAESFGYSGTRSATVQKYKCLEKVRDVIKSKSLNYENFAE